MMVARRAPAADPDGLTGAARTPRPAPGDAESAAPAPDSARAAPPQVRLLGPPSLASDTDEAPLPPERRTRLLAYLACRRTWVTRDSLLALFWPDRDPSSARNNLRYVLLQARRLRGLDNLEVRGEALRWPVETDLHRFESAVAAGDWAGAIAWYRGPLLEGFEADAPPPFAEWLDFERARLAASWRESIHRRLADPTLVAGGRAELAARLLRDDPLDQAAMAALMRAQDQLGQAALAVDAYRHYAARLRAELGVEPAAALRDLARRIEAGGAGAAPDAPLPRAPEDRADESDEIVGRRTELAQIAQFLGAADCRVLTLTGPGGIGKSRLARAARARLQAHFPDGVWWVGLEDLQNVTQVVARCAAIAGVPLAAQTDPVQVLVRQLAQRNALLLLDNSEHLPELGSFVATLVRECSGIKVLATSRARLGCSGEWLLPLDGLAVPDEGESDVGVLRAFDAVRLFELRARTARFDFDLVRDALAVNELVRQVEGMPLALELAAAWVRLLPVREIARELRHSLELLDMPQGQSARERGMRASFAHSWAMLAPAEQRALAALSVFTGSFTHAAARHVAEAPLPLLAALADKSLVRADDDGRFSLHALIRQCAAERLAQDPAANDAVLARHAAWFAHTMQQFHSFHAIDHAAALRTIAAELPNVLAAWDWSLQHEDVGFLATCAPGLGNYFQMRGPAQQGLALFEAAEQVMQDAGPVAGDARWILPLERASLHHSLGQYALLEQAARRALKGAPRRVRHPHQPQQHRHRPAAPGPRRRGRPVPGRGAAARPSRRRGQRDPLLRRQSRHEPFRARPRRRCDAADPGIARAVPGQQAADRRDASAGRTRHVLRRAGAHARGDRLAGARAAGRHRGRRRDAPLPFPRHAGTGLHRPG
jgi:predicted ATPase